MTTTELPRPTRSRRSAFDRRTATRLAATEYQRFLAQLRSLDAADWSLPTDCPLWDVRAMATHNLGMAVMASSLREMLRQQKLAGKHGGVFVDALTGLQVAERARMTPPQIVAAYAEIVEPAVRGRRRRSITLGRIPTPLPETYNGVEERWSIGYFIDTILTRDTWMHRVDTAQATGRSMQLSAEHDGVIVDDVVTEWAARHGRPFSLRLSGPAGGAWSRGTSGPQLALDAVQFCRTLARRASGAGLLGVEVPF